MQPKIYRTQTAAHELASLLAFALLAALAIPATGAAQSAREQGHRDVTVITRNLYFGASLDGVITAGSPYELLLEVEAVWQAVQATDFYERSEVLADEIASAGADLVGLQEAVLWRIQPEGDLLVGGTTPATEVAYDFVQILLDDLAERGAYYEVVVSLDELDAELPSITGADIRLTDRDVVLARTDLPPGFLRILATDSGHFENLEHLPVGGSLITILRGWVAADVKVRGKMFRFLNAHLEDVPFVATQEAQAVELLVGPAAVPWPVVLVGDLNSDAFGPGTGTYEILLAGGFDDAWTAVQPVDPGLTWGNDPGLRNPVPMLTERLDFVLYLGSFSPVDAFVVGEELRPDEHRDVAFRSRRCRNDASDPGAIRSVAPLSTLGGWLRS